MAGQSPPSPPSPGSCSSPFCSSLAWVAAEPNAPAGAGMQLGLSEPLPSSAAGFRSSAYFALAHQLSDTEMLRPPCMGVEGGEARGRGSWEGGHADDGAAKTEAASRVPVLGTLVLDGVVGSIISREHVAVLRTHEQV